MVKSLIILAAECVARGQFKSGDEQMLVKILAGDLAGVNEEIAIDAIRRHRETSPFFPHISDLRPRINHSQAMLDRVKAVADRMGNRSLDG